MRRSTLALILFTLPACGRASKEASPASAPPAAQEAKLMARDEEESDNKELARPKSAPAPGRRAGLALKRRGGEGGGADKATADSSLAGLVANAPAPAEPEAPANAPPPTRAWFPEAFLFEPRTITDAQGAGSLEFKIPDRLTTWRILGLAHTREGQQAGALAEVLGTLPVYVEPVVPSFLTSGDEVRLPIQVVNTTEGRVDKTLKIRAEGGLLASAGARAISLAGGRTAIETVVLRASKPGSIELFAELAGTDAITRAIPVRPRGLPVVEERGGTLAAPRTLELTLQSGVDREATELDLAVYPGALAVLRSELAGAGLRSDASDAAYALQLAGRAQALATSLGGEVDLDLVRTLRIASTQRALRNVRTPSVEGSILFAEAAAAHPNEPLLSRLGERLFADLANLQRPDGTFSGQSGWTLQRLLATTAIAAQALDTAAISPEQKTRAAGARIRASAVFERNAARIEDPYTAGLIVVSKAVSGDLKKELQKKVKDAAEALPDGSRVVRVPSGVVRTDGSRPSEVEVTAIAALALEDDAEPAFRQDLGAFVLSSYRPYSAFGDGQANLWCLKTVLSLFKDKLPEAVHISVELDGKLLRDGLLDTAKVKDVLHLQSPAPSAEGTHQYKISAEPPVPGLAFTLRLKSWAPVKTPEHDGLDLRIALRGALVVGRPISVDLLAVAPSGRALTIVQGLPAGVDPDRPSLDALVSANTIERWAYEDGKLTLWVRPLAPSTPFRASYRVFATLAGTLNAAPSVLTAEGAPPHAISGGSWSIR